MAEALATTRRSWKTRQRRASTCRACGGPHPFDTSVPSVLWNRVVRPWCKRRRIGEFLCLTCITALFVRAGTGFTATLWGTFRGRHLPYGVAIEVRVGGRAARTRELLERENNRLRVGLGTVHDAAGQMLHEATRARRGR